MCDSEVKAAVSKITNSTAARTLFHDNQSYVTFLCSEWRIGTRFRVAKHDIKVTVSDIGD